MAWFEGLLLDFTNDVEFFDGGHHEDLRSKSSVSTPVPTEGRYDTNTILFYLTLVIYLDNLAVENFSVD